jgi:ArsR family transcriptional regulator
MAAAPPLRSPDLRQRLAAICHALSDETRIRIIEKLLGGECCVCDLTDALDAGQSRLSFHLKALKEAGLVTDRREGRWVYYTLDSGTLTSLCRLLEAVRDAASVSSGCCAPATAEGPAATKSLSLPSR